MSEIWVEVWNSGELGYGRIFKRIVKINVRNTSPENIRKKTKKEIMRQVEDILDDDVTVYNVLPKEDIV